MTREQVRALIALHRAGGLHLLKEPREVGKELSRWIRQEIHFSDVPDFELVEQAIETKVACYFTGRV